MQPADIEKYVIKALNHVGWYRSCWFPRVERESLNFPGGPTDEEVRSALFRLVQAGALEVGHEQDDGFVPVNDPLQHVIEDIQTNDKSIYDLRLSEEASKKLSAALGRAKVPARGHFELFAHGASFDPDAYLASATIEFDNVWYRAEGRPQTSGVGRRLGDGARLSLAEQDRIAVEFLSAHRESLQALAKFPGVETFILRLQVNIEVGDGLAGSGYLVSLSPQLMWYALKIGIRPDIHLAFDDPGLPLSYDFSEELFLEGWQ